MHFPVARWHVELHQVKIEDEWVECRGTCHFGSTLWPSRQTGAKGDIAKGLIKAKHIVGMISLGKDAAASLRIGVTSCATMRQAVF